MSAETLRKAAALMRERAAVAEKVHASPWRPMGAGSVVFPMTKRMLGTVAETYPRGGSAHQVATTDHIASWHPAVALAVADMLDRSADADDQFRLPQGPSPLALAVARAYLGES